MKLLDSRALYYVLRVLQRCSLLTTGLLTVIYWAVLLEIEIDTTLSREQLDHQWRNANGLDGAIRATIDHLSWQVAAAALGAVVLSLALLVFPRVRKCEKRMVIDGLVIALFCILTVILSTTLEANFIRHYLVQYHIAL